MDDDVTKSTDGEDALVKYSGQEVTLPLLVVKGEGPSLLGRNWVEEIKLN